MASIHDWHVLAAFRLPHTGNPRIYKHNNKENGPYGGYFLRAGEEGASFGTGVATAE